MRYYRPTVGSDYVPVEHAWIDRWAVPGIFVAAVSLMGATIWCCL